MTLKCAWCEHEGRSAHVEEVEPLENRADTHGLCAQHRREWLASLGLEDLRSGRPAPPP